MENFNIMALFKTVTTPFTNQPTMPAEPLSPVLPEKPPFQGGRPTATLIQNGTIVTVEGTQKADLLVIGETIAALSKKFNVKGLPPNTKVLDATGCYVFPGGIDPHTHMEMPFMGTQSSDDFETGTRAALIGGTTTILDFAMQDANHSLLETLAQWESKAQKAVCDYGFHMAVTHFDPATSPLEMATLVKDRGITSFKVFMAYKQALMVGDDALLAILDEATKHRATVLAHCEHGDMIDYLVQKAKSQGRLTADYHAKTRPTLVEAEATGRFTDLAYLTNANIYIVHLSCKDALDRVRQAMARGQQLNVETCIQYLLLSDALYEQETPFDAAKWVFSPPLRAYEDQVALWQGVKQGLIKTVATDHCPFCMSQKAMGQDDFSLIPNGMPGVEHRFELLYSEGVEAGKITLEEFVALTSTNAAKIFGMHPKKGTLTVGADADMVVFNPNVKHQIFAATHHMNCDYSAFEGWPVTGKVQTVLRRGEWVVHEGQCVAARGSGNFLARTVTNA